MSDEKENIELKSLVSLIDEPDDLIYEQIREKLITYGIDAVPFLEEAWEKTFDNFTQKRIESLIHNLQFDNVLFKLRNWYLLGGKDLLSGFIIITKYQYPDLDEEKIIKQIGKITQDVWLELNDNLTALEKVKIINHVFYNIHGFKGNKQNFHAPQNSYINNLLETKKGNPLSLSIIYSIIAQSLKVPIYGVNLPEHFILSYTNELISDFTKTKDSDVLFYINAFNKGTIFSINELQLFLKQLKLKPNAMYFTPCDNIQIIKRLIYNLTTAYEKLGYPDKIGELERLLGVLE
ncbi:MAG: transglutaminase-like domain-containing protein [Saprospiraceae bacterium]|nr:transglutaminase-like domain-containing protein [Saprospiraceae bacterium]